jgi:GntR family transcriptional regulator
MTRSGLSRFEPSTDRPLYRQVIDSLRIEIAKKVAGDRIDSEPQLSRRFGVSRFTITRAIESLADEGLINRRQGLGTFVAAPQLKRASTYLASFGSGFGRQARQFSSRAGLRTDPLARGSSLQRG